MEWCAANRRMVASRNRFTPDLWTGLGNTAFSHPQPDPRTLGQSQPHQRLSQCLPGPVDDISCTWKN